MLLSNRLLLTIVLPVVSSYEPNWSSLDSRPLPSWYDEAKIGIFMHFGPYAVPGAYSEWFWMQWHQLNPKIVKFMEENYPPNFTYQDFGSELKMEFFNASKFAELVHASGAKYLVFTSKHHDGFTNFPSPYTFGWNSKDVGPKRDVVNELKLALDRYHGMHFGLYYSLFEWFNPMYLQDKASNFTSRTYVTNKMLPELKYLAQRYAPDIIWGDGAWEATDEYFGSQEFLAWLYNSSPQRKNVIVNDRWGRGTEMKHGGFYSGPDKFSPGHLLAHKFEDAFTVDLYSWGNRRNIDIGDIITYEELIATVASVVSCNGNVLINVGPTKEGTIIPIFQERLLQLGSWLGINGEAIYSTRPWTHQNDSLSKHPQVWYTSKQDVVYGIVLGWPLDDVLILADVQISPHTEILMLGFNKPLKFKKKEGKTYIYFPSMSSYLLVCGSGCQYGYTLKFTGLSNNHEDLDYPQVEIL